MSAFERKVNVVPPVGWLAVTILLAAFLACAIVFLAVTPYSRVETVTGIIVPAKGVAQIVPQRSGVIAEILVEEGQWIDRGTEMFVIRTETDLQGGRSAGDEVNISLELQRRSLATQRELIGQTLAAQQMQVSAQEAGERSKIDELQTQIQLQENLVINARADLARAEQVAKNGFISERDLDTRRATLIVRQQEQARLNSALVSSWTTLRELSVRRNELSAQSAGQLARLQADDADVSRDSTLNEGGRAFIVKAPVAGRVSALVARSGQSVSGTSTLTNIIPGDTVLEAQIYVPSAAIGFVKEGQQINLAIDTFPFQRFGTIPSSIQTISDSPLPVRETAAGPVTAYIATANISRTWITAFGKEESLLPGMTFSARIITDSPTLMEWLFEPIIAVRQR